MSPLSAPTIISSSSSPSSTFVIDESDSHMMYQPLIATSSITSHTNVDYDSNSSSLIREDSIGPYDILCGRTKLALNHIGNRRFRITINMNLQSYQTSQSRIEKSVLIGNVVQFLQEEAGSRFLKPMSGNKGYYMELNEKQAREKVGHAFRDAVSTTSRRKKESSSKSKNSKKQSSSSKSRCITTSSTTTTTTPAVPDVPVPPPRSISPMPRAVSDTYPEYKTTTTTAVVDESKECYHNNATTTSAIVNDDDELFDFEPLQLLFEV